MSMQNNQGKLLKNQLHTKKFHYVKGYNSKGMCTSDHDHRFLKSLIGWEMGGGPTLFTQGHKKSKVTMIEHV